MAELFALMSVSLPVLLVNRDLVHINAFCEPSLVVSKLHVIPTHLPLSHAAIFCKGPIFKSISSPPLAGFIVPLIPKLDRNLPGGSLISRRSFPSTSGITERTFGSTITNWLTYLVLRESKQFFPQAIAILFGPFLGQESDDLICASNELISVSPNRVRGISSLYNLWVPKNFLIEGHLANDERGTDFVFQASCAAFTLTRAVSIVKGGSGGLVAMILLPFGACNFFAV